MNSAVAACALALTVPALEAQPSHNYSPIPDTSMYVSNDNVAPLLGYKNGNHLWHDQQRLRLPCKPATTCRYDAFANLYSTLLNDGLRADADFVEPRLVAIIDLPESGAKHVRPTVKAGVNRVYLQFVGGQWSGSLRDPAGVSRVLKVARQMFADTLPAVAQWGWDEPAQQQLIGVRCGLHGWCELSETTGTITPTPVPTCPAGAPFTCYTKGYYDDQLLAREQRGHPNGPPIVSGVYGHIYPALGIVPLPQAAYVNTWKHVANLTVNRLYSSHNYRLLPGRVYKEELCIPGGSRERRDRGAACGQLLSSAPASIIGQRPSAAQQPRQQPPYIARLSYTDAAGEHVVAHFWIRGPHDHLSGTTPPGGSIPGTARWQWNDFDEGTWVACQQGCCDLQYWSLTGPD